MHSLDLFWSGRNGHEVVVKCPCGWKSEARRPELKETYAQTLAEYRAHFS